MLQPHPMILLSVISSLAMTAANAAPAQLSSDALDNAVAGAESTSEIESTNPAIIVVDDSQVDFHLHREVLLNGYSQSDLRALNLVNGARTDVANAINVLHASNGLSSLQHNRIEQTESRGGSAASIERFGVNRITTSEQRSRSDMHSAASSYTERTLRTRSHTSVTNTFNVNVPEYNPFRNASFSLTTPYIPPIDIPRFGFGLYDDTIGTGFYGSIGPIAFQAPQLSLGTVALSGDDITITGGYLDMGSLQLGEISVSVCVAFECAGDSVDLGRIQGPRIDFGSAGTLTLEGANPFKDIHLNAGSGMALAGSGHVVTTAAHVNVSAAVTLEIPDIDTGFDFTVFGEKFRHGGIHVDIPDIHADTTLINEDIGPDSDVTFNGVLCVTGHSINCGTVSHVSANEDIHVEVMRSAASAIQSQSSSSSATGTESIVIGARMTGAEADLIAMSEGTANIDTTSLVQLDSQAQRGMSVVNAVNATGAMVGNAMNTATQRSTVQLGSQPSGSIGQSNVFTQYQTRPRTP